MPLKKRIIPCLDVDKGRVVKGTQFLSIRDAGDPVELAAKYYEEGADEICFLDITASHEERKATYEIIKKTAEVVFVPLTVGGGVNSVEDAYRLLDAGADKVGINSGAIKNPSLINESSKKFGSQCIVLAVDAKRQGDSWQVYINGGRINTEKDVIDWILEGVDRGAGEILLTSMDADGKQLGYDLELYSKISSLVNVPIIASGGAGSLNDIIEVLEKGADAALLASLLHYGDLSISEIKKAMAEASLELRK
jgi:imidazole glycerol-phosphate synthase subunit HisF